MESVRGRRNCATGWSATSRTWCACRRSRRGPTRCRSGASSRITTRSGTAAAVIPAFRCTSVASCSRCLNSAIPNSTSRRASCRELILCGDINIARADIDVHPKERKPGVIGQRAEERELFEALLDRHLVDVTRALDLDNQGLFTWWPPWRNMRQRNIGWRIDYILASRAIAERATRCTVLADVGTSDHAPIMMTTA